jgi:hypothetical protein
MLGLLLIAAVQSTIGMWLPQYAPPNAIENDLPQMQRDHFTATADGGTPVSVSPKQQAHVYYDAVHNITLFASACCGWHEIVLANASSPPQTLASKDLSGVQTARGIHLGMTFGQLQHIYGAGRPQAVPQHPELRVVAYRTYATTYYKSNVLGKCPEFMNFYMDKNVVVAIQLGSGC